ncbi:uracil-DNA glycosylase [Candidatus Epulonipiscium fishelsonii]|uniref:Uracil-DNA glycosylase n=1 Tax=Candidatus Epulonipiscium fishelsonii TaxID=77094 RepID=A0ACC8XJI1_9FIRM|nr:uracil-DNA glycosylase [Epulopiscium sp. SCG-D08WGA-EpuloA1]OON93762.1 MAG: uracil-DNA glycosylase [Epulopiscium sp. AS2M-Bin002]
MIKFNNSWDNILKDEFEKPYYKKLRQFLKEEYATQTIYPKPNDIFTAFKITSYEDVKVVIIGQDPYHGEAQAHGLSFSVQPGIKIPPSLLNIYKEIQSSFGYDIPKTGYLLSWAQQGVFLLNTVLTVRAAQPNSHQNSGWEIFTDNVISYLNDREKPIVFLLWGAPAQRKKVLITNPHHYVLMAPHPSPLSANRGFFGCNHFRKTNEILESLGETPINWQIK